MWHFVTGWFGNVAQATTRFQEKDYGLNQVYPAPGNTAVLTDIDIIAIHGLHCDSFTTWIAREVEGELDSRKVHWLHDADMLPKFVSNARIFTFNWNGKLDQTASGSSFLGQADMMLEQLKNSREEETRDRPIVFIASCFGGLLLIKALHRASQVNSEYHRILTSTVGTMFLGTPFRGSHSDMLKAYEQRVVSVVANGLVNYLRNDDLYWGPLKELVQSFQELVHTDQFRFPIVCFYETEPTELKALWRDLPKSYQKHLQEGEKAILVNQHSACLEGSKQIGLPVRHSMLNKYRGPEDKSFVTVRMNLKRLIKDIPKTLQSKKLMSSAHPYWIEPLERNTGFAGQEDEIGELRRRLLAGVHTTKTAVAELEGMRKTQLVLELLYQMRTEREDCSII